ncbi:unnamed protein product [Rhizophagus irregularis]|nr:unnamed protein product [Rhizophagus irregularis]
MSPDQVELWLKYHNVVINNNTTRTNQYQLLLDVFIVIDNKNKMRFVCQVLANSALDATIPIVFPETYSAHCIFYIAQNLPKNLKAKLGEKWKDFIKQFYQCCNSLCEPLFKQRWNKLLNDYPMAKNYLLHTLDQKFKS